MENIKKIQVLIGAVLFVASSQTFAIPSISGEIGMIGAFDPVDSSWNITGISDATGIDFDPNKFKVLTATGTFSSIASGTLGDITDLQFDSFSGPIVDFWNVDGFSFDLTSISKGFSSDPNNKLVLEGLGTISTAGYMDTAGTWTFTGQTTSAGGVFTWSAGSTTMVPEPGMLTLLGIGLIGLSWTKKKDNKLN